MKNQSSNGKGKRPIIGYNPRNWYKNYDRIFKQKPKRK